MLSDLTACSQVPLGCAVQGDGALAQATRRPPRTPTLPGNTRSGPSGAFAGPGNPHVRISRRVSRRCLSPFHWPSSGCNAALCKASRASSSPFCWVRAHRVTRGFEFVGLCSSCSLRDCCSLCTPWTSDTSRRWQARERKTFKLLGHHPAVAANPDWQVPSRRLERPRLQSVSLRLVLVLSVLLVLQVWWRLRLPRLGHPAISTRHGGCPW